VRCCYTERVRCGAVRQVLGVAGSGHDVDVVAELRSRLEAAGLVATSSSMIRDPAESEAGETAAAAKYQTTIDELRSSNDALRAKLKAVVKSSQDAKQRHTRDVAKLQKTLSQLQLQQQQQQQQQQQRATEQAVAVCKHFLCFYF